MTENWEDIIKNKLQNDAITPPPSAWESINDSAWTNKIKSKTQQASHPPVPKKLTLKVFHHAQIQPYFGGIGLKAAAVFIGIAASALAIYTQTQNSQTPNSQPQTEVTTNAINPQTEITTNSQPQTEVTTNAINPQTEITTNSQLQTEATQTPNSQLQTDKTQTEVATIWKNPPTPNFKPQTIFPQTISSKTEETQTEVTPNSQLQTPYSFYSKSLTHTPVNPLNLSELFPNFPRKKKSKPSHLKPDFSVHAGLQQRLNKLKYTNSKERSTYQHWPIQRDQGLIVGLTLNNKWILETGIFNASAKSNLAITNLPFYKTPIKINAQRKTIEIHTPHHQKVIDARGVALFPNGTNWRDTSKYFAISFEENHHAQFIEIPLSMGYKHNWRRFLFSAQLGGMLFLPQKIQSDFLLTINNNENTTFEFSEEKTVKNIIRYEGFAQMQVGYNLIPQLNTYINVLLPGLHENNPNAIASAQNLRFQVGLNYNF